MNRKILLQAIPCTEPANFFELCRALGDNTPENSGEWRELFELLETLEFEGLVTVSRSGRTINTVQLTPQGADLVRKALKDGKWNEA